MGRSFYCWTLTLILTLALKSVVPLGSYLTRLDGTNVPEVIYQDVFFEITEPDDLGYTYRTRPAKNFGAPFNVNFMARDAKLVPVDPEDGCSKLKNADQVNGNIALVQRGVCSFLSKTLIAEESGARAVIIADNELSDEYYTEMIDDLSGRDANIPATFLLGKNGFMIKKYLAELNLDYALINIPVNLSYVPLHKMNQPPWLTW